MNSVKSLTAGDVQIVGARGKADPIAPDPQGAPDIGDAFLSILARLTSAQAATPSPAEGGEGARREVSIGEEPPRANTEPVAIDDLTVEEPPLPDPPPSPDVDGRAVDADPAAEGDHRPPPLRNDEGVAAPGVPAIPVAMAVDKPAPPPGPPPSTATGPPALAGDPAPATPVNDAPPSGPRTPGTAERAPAAAALAGPQPRPPEARSEQARSPQAGARDAGSDNENAARTEPAPPRATVVDRQTHFAPARPVVVPIGPLSARAPQPETPGAAKGQAPLGRGVEEPRSGQASETLEPKAAAPVVANARADADRSPRPAGKRDAPTTPVAAASAAPPPSATPALAASDLQKIAGAILEAAGEPQAATRPTAAPQEAGTGGSTAPAPLRVLTVRLDLPDRGALDVRLSLGAGGLSLRLTAEREETAHRLRYDRDRLVEVLRGAGYDTDIAAIEARRPETAPAARLDPAASQGQANGGPTGNANPGQSGAQQRSGEPPRPPSGVPGEPFPLDQGPTRDEIDRAADRRPGALYV